MKTKRGQFSGITRPRDRTTYEQRLGATKVTHLVSKTGHCYFVKETFTSVTVTEQTNDSIIFNKDVSMSLENFNAYFERRPRECQKCSKVDNLP